MRLSATERSTIRTALLRDLARLALTLSLLAAPVAAQQPQVQKPPGVGYVYPPVLRPGTTTDVTIGGFDWTDDLEWFVHRGDVHLEPLGPPGDYILTPPPYWVGPRASTPPQPIPREVAARIRIDAAAPPGLVRWQVANANGASATAVFLISDGNEITESRSRDLPQRLPELPVAVSGRLSRLTEVDRYEIAATRDGPISIDLTARRIGSRFHGQIEVRDAAGKTIADFADTQGLDGGLTFPARSGQTYVVSLHDVDFRGDRSFLYRLAFSQGPCVLGSIPARGRRGETAEVEWIGYGIASGAGEVEVVRSSVPFPADPPQSSLHWTLQTSIGPAFAAVPLSDLPEFAASRLSTVADERSSPKTASVIPAPAAVTGRLHPAAPDPQFLWTSAEKESWAASLESPGLGSPHDLTLKILDPDGKVIAESDDQPGGLDARLQFTAVKAGTYLAVIHSLTPSSGLPTDLYRLEIRRQEPDFTLRIPQTIDLPLGDKTSVKITAQRLGGFSGPITLRAEGLGAGVRADGEWTIPAEKNELTVTLEAAKDADVAAKLIRVQGTATIGEQSVTRDALAVAAGNLAPASPEDSLTPNVLLAVTMAPPFEIHVVDRERQREVHRGTTYPAELEIHRFENFQGAMQIAMTAQQDRDRQGMRGPLLPVPAGATRVLYPCTMPEWLGTELTRRIVVQGVAPVPDPKGRLRYLTRAADARITMIMEGALLKLSCEGTEESRTGQSTPRPGDTIEIPVSLSRSVKLPPAETTVVLEVPEELTGVIDAAPVVLPAGTDRGRITLKTVVDPRLTGDWPLRVRATTLQDGQWPVVSFATVPLEFP